MGQDDPKVEQQAFARFLASGILAVVDPASKYWQNPRSFPRFELPLCALEDFDDLESFRDGVEALLDIYETCWTDVVKRAVRELHNWCNEVIKSPGYYYVSSNRHIEAMWGASKGMLKRRAEYEADDLSNWTQFMLKREQKRLYGSMRYVDDEERREMRERLVKVNSYIRG